jgi:hypothetical protein
MRPELSLPVVWTDNANAPLPGRLELAGTHLQLVGGSRNEDRSRELKVADIASTRLGRSADERIGGRRTLVLELRDGGTIRIAGFERPGALRELADRLQAAIG